MIKKLVVRAAGISLVLLAGTAVNPVYAQDSNGYNLGFLASESGDYTTAAKQWQPLASQGDALAQFNLALMYHRGLGVNLDEGKAVSWYQKSAENGYSKAQEFLAVAYREGWFGLAQDQKKAEYWDKQIENSSF
ncbi:MAG: sel1 repeat family protein [Ectothiorhodospiraceae bacterium]|nr:sel1 repeat family protein [Ectothiorhodospiraceae bacterium]